MSQKIEEQSNKIQELEKELRYQSFKNQKLEEENEKLIEENKQLFEKNEKLVEGANGAIKAKLFKQSLDNGREELVNYSTGDIPAFPLFVSILSAKTGLACVALRFLPPIFLSKQENM